MKIKLIPLFVLSIAVLFGNTESLRVQTFVFKSGDRITGMVLGIDENGIYSVRTNYGVVQFNRLEIYPENISAKLISGIPVKGIILEENENQYIIQSSSGIITLKKSEIRNYKISTDRQVNLHHNPLRESKTQLQNQEQLIDIWFDPVGFILPENEMYFSGLSWGYGFTDKIQISTRWINYFWSDFNIRPKIQIYKSSDLKITDAVSIGTHVHLRGLPNKYEFINEVRTDTIFIPNGVPIINEYVVQEWSRIGTIDEDENSGNQWEGKYGTIWGEIFLTASRSILRNSGVGKITWNTGINLTFYSDEPVMPRAFLAADIDIRNNLKLMAELFYDPYYAPWINRVIDEDVSLPVHIDFGFIYRYNQNLRIGIHYQQPFLTFYYRF